MNNNKQFWESKQTKAPTYTISVSPKLDPETGLQLKDQYGHPIFTRDYSNWPKYKRVCPECLAEYEYQYPDLEIMGDGALIGVNGYAKGFICPNCGAQIVHWANSDYMAELPPTEDQEPGGGEIPQEQFDQLAKQGSDPDANITEIQNQLGDAVQQINEITGV